MQVQCLVLHIPALTVAKSCLFKLVDRAVSQEAQFTYHNSTSTKCYFQGYFSTEQRQRMLVHISFLWERCLDMGKLVLSTRVLANLFRGCTVCLHCCPGSRNSLHHRAGIGESCNGGGGGTRSVSKVSSNHHFPFCFPHSLLSFWTIAHVLQNICL